MKKIIITILLAMATPWITAQQMNVPELMLKKMNGEYISTANALNTGQVTWLVFWNADEPGSIDYLETIMEACNSIQEEKEMILIAIYVDCHGVWTNIKPLVDGFGWEMHSYIDLNNDLKRSFSIGQTPSAMLLDKEMNLLCKYSSNCMGTEEYVVENMLAYFDDRIFTNELSFGK